jgi:hypothetical protein
VFGAEELRAPFLSQQLGHINIGGTAVVPAARIAFCILIGHDAALCFHDRSTCEVLGCDQDEGVALPLKLGLYRGCHFRIHYA